MSINLSFRNCDSFAFTDNSHLSNKTDKKLTITFPDGNVLIFSDFESLEEVPSTGVGNLGYDGSEILGDLDEWGMDIDKTFSANIETLTEDIELNPSMFQDSDGNNTSFTYTYFPSGVYHVEYSYTSDGRLGEYETYTFHKDTATLYLKEKIEWLFAHDTDSNTSEYEYDTIERQVMQMIMLMQIAEFEFNSNSYAESNLKLVACDRIYSTGSMSYKYDEAR